MVTIRVDKAGVYLHVGAHRTGTSSFQEFISLNFGRLKDHGVTVAVSNRGGSRNSSLKLRLPDKRHFRRGDLSEHQTWLDDELEKRGINAARVSLVSEENMVGPISSILSPAIYPIARDRLAFVKASLKRPVRRVLFAVRSYETFFASAHRMRAEFRELDPFDTYRPEVLKMERDWVDVVEDIQSALQPDEIQLIRVEDRPGYEDMLHRLLPGLPHGGWIMPDGRQNESATDAACFAMQAAFARGQKLSKDDVAEIKAQHADDTSGPPFVTFTEAERATLRDRYEADVDRLRALPNVVFD